MKFMFVYILECSDGSYYTGVTNNLEMRLEQHQQGINVNSYTFTRRPVKMVFHQLFHYPNEAFIFETKIKKWSRAKKKALIDEQYHKLPALSKKKFK